MNDSDSISKVPKHRSPSYPAYDLETVLARAKDLHKLAGNHPANVSTVISAWNYSAKSSKGLLMLAAIKRFGLADDRGRGDSRVLALTQLGRELVHYDTDRTSEHWKQRAQVAALNPTIHRELWRRYSGQLPTDSVLRDHMVLERGFSRSAANEVIAEFRRTLAFAGISTAGDANIELPPEGEEAKEQDQNVTPPTTPQAPPISQPPAPHAWPPAAPPPPDPGTEQPEKSSAPLPVNVNLSDSGWATLQVSGRLTKAQWDQLMAVLNAMKPGLTV
jgi:hypothetical protein